MIKESDKYKAQYFQIGAFSSMAPFGKIVLDIKDMTNDKLTIYLLAHFLLSLSLLYFGMILLYKGLQLLEAKDK